MSSECCMYYINEKAFITDVYKTPKSVLEKRSASRDFRHTLRCFKVCLHYAQFVERHG